MAPSPSSKPSLLNSRAGLVTELEKPVMGTRVPAPANLASLGYSPRPVNKAEKDQGHRSQGGSLLLGQKQQVQVGECLAQYTDQPAHQKGGGNGAAALGGGNGFLNHGVVFLRGEFHGGFLLWGISLPDL